MKILKTSLFSLLIIGLILQFGCTKKQPLNKLSVGPQTIAFGSAGGSANLALQTDAQSWQIDNPNSDWVNLSSTSGTGKEATITLSVDTKSLTQRYDTITITAGNAKPVQVTVSQLPSQYLYTLSTNISSNLNFAKAGDSATITIHTDAPKWQIASDTTWLQFSRTSGSSSDTTVTVKAPENKDIGSRSGTITLTADHAPSVKISVIQKGDLYPNYNTSPLPPDPTGMSSTAQQIATKMTLGWNLGNTLEATGGETAWGNPKASQALIDLVNNNGFNAIRIPCSWNQYANQTTAKIQDSWLQRVKQVVQYCINDNMYVILNIHWDGGWLQDHCDVADSAAVNAKQKAFWQQIATYMRGFGEHLMFASTNEPSVKNASQMKVLLSYHQTFINAVRSTGGKNSYRVLIVQGPSTDIVTTNQLMNTMPTDSIPNRLMVEVHDYTPYQFTLMTSDADWGKMFYYWGKNYHSKTDTTRNATWGEESYVDSTFLLMKNQFVDKGIPVVLGEFGAIRRSELKGDSLTLHLNSRAHFLEYITREAKANGMIPFYWDAGNMGKNASALFDRQNNTIYDQQALDSLKQGAGE